MNLALAHRSRAILALLLTGAIVLSGCATVSPRLDTAENRELCRSWLAADSGGSWEASQSYKKVMYERSLGEADCRLLSRRSVDLSKVAMAFVILAAARSGSGYASSSARQDVEWDWDQFHNQYGQLLWVCRGVQTGQFAEDGRCVGKLRTDWRWPSKQY